MREADMPDYRVYPIDGKGHIVDAPNVVTCDSDQEAIEQARALANSHDVELWDGARRVSRRIGADGGR
jgi:hypothetical protein